ncbi:hypothetical protein [Delftia acidovorans]|uniref:hypothetical protein n=1 Tax=Delftia acidovorans TaxID=80866 RepID=UPI00192C8D97|nr:hypothetical protein [Delftia acidovorans]
MEAADKQTPSALIFARHIIGMALVAMANPLIWYSNDAMGFWVGTWVGPLVISGAFFGLYWLFFTQRAKMAWPGRFFMLAWVLLALSLAGPWVNRSLNANMRISAQSNSGTAQQPDSAPINSQKSANDILKELPPLPQAYRSRVAVLEQAAEAGALSIVFTRRPEAIDGDLKEWPASEVSAIEDWQTWWIRDDVIGIHIVNSSNKKIGVLEIKHALGSCELATASDYLHFTLPLARPIEPRSQALIKFLSGGNIPKTNGCLIVSRIRG